MSVVRFGIYYRQHATEREVFEVGDVPVLKAYDFGDVDFESGDLLSFVLEGGALVAASNAAFEDPEAFRELLFRAPMITGTVLDSGFSAPFRVDSRETFRDFYERKEHAITNEIIEVVHEYDDMWGRTRETLARFAREGRDYRYSVDWHLPVVSAVQRSIERGLAATKRRGDYTLLLESFPTEPAVRVVAYGPDWPDACRIYDILDVNEYRAAIEERLAKAQLERETRFWNYLLD